METSIPTYPVTARQRPWRRRVSHLLLHIFLSIGGFFMVLPFLWMLSTSLTAQENLFRFPPQWIPRPIAWWNYVDIVTILPFGRAFVNTMIMAVGVTLLQIFTSSLSAFAFARLRFPGRDALFLLYLATLMVPFYVTLIPSYLIIRGLGWIDTFFALIIPRSFSAFSTFLLRQYFLSLPFEYDDAARIDGASSFAIWWRIIMPLSQPALAALTVFIFLGEWNNLLWPLVVTLSEEMRTLQVLLAGLRGEFTIHWQLIMAGASLSLLPILALYLIGQKWFVQGFTFSGLAGR